MGKKVTGIAFIIYGLGRGVYVWRRVTCLHMCIVTLPTYKLAILYNSTYFVSLPVVPFSTQSATSFFSSS